MIGDMRMHKNNTSGIKRYSIITVRSDTWCMQPNDEGKRNMGVFVGKKVMTFTEKTCVCVHTDSFKLTRGGD